MRRFRVKRSEPGLVRVETRVRPAERAALVSRAAGCGVSQAEFLRVMLQLELEEAHPFSAAAYLRLAASQEQELERRGRVRASVAG
jgi:hypothetical protein